MTFTDTYFNHADWLGTVRLRTDQNGAPIGGESFTSLPFGDVLSANGASPYHFTDQMHDAESGLEHFVFRQYSSTQGRWMTHRLGRKVAAHAHGAQGVSWASDAGVDSIEHGHLMDENSIATLKKNGTYLVPTLYLTEWWAENMEKMHAPTYLVDKMKMVMANSQKIHQKAFKAGVKIALGTDAAVYPHGLNAHELETYVKLGLTPLQAIQSATINDADLLGWSDKIGTLEAGKFADIIAVDGDPLKDIKVLQHVTFVMKAGKVYKNESK